MAKTRVLFVAEAVTLAHVVRLVSLARSLDPALFHCYFATDPRYSSLIGELPTSMESIASMPPRRFQRAISTGTPIFDHATLARYAKDDLALIARVGPDVVVSDFRVSLGVSAREAGIPLVNLTNAYWSPYARIRHVVPDFRAVAAVGTRVAQPIFNALRRTGYAAHARPINRLRRDYGMPALGRDFREALVDGDATLYADVPEIVPTAPLPATHRFIGPVPWSPSVPVPVWWNDWIAERARHRLIYVSLGSSGPRAALQTVLDALSALPVRAAVATAGTATGLRVPPNARIAELLPGDGMVAAATLVVCNGGSPSTYQALAAGVPVIGIATNMDQFLNMAAVEDASCGRLLRARSCSESDIRSAVLDGISNPRLRDGALRAKRAIARYHPFARFLETVRNVSRHGRI